MFYCQGHNIFALIYLAKHCSVCVISTNKKLHPKPATETPEKTGKYVQNNINDVIPISSLPNPNPPPPPPPPHILLQRPHRLL